MDSSVRVLLSEQQREIVSLLTLSLSDIKECELEVCEEPAVLLERVQQVKTGMVLLNSGKDPQEALTFLRQIHDIDPGVYVIVSLPEGFRTETDSVMKAGAHDCVYKDRNYVSNIVSAVKKALIRIAERDAFDVPVLARAQQLAMDEYLPDMIFSLDLDGGILYANHAISTLLGYQQQEVVGMPFATLMLTKEEQIKFRNYLEAVDQCIGFREIIALKDSLGKSTKFDVNFTLMEGEIIYGVARKHEIVDVEFSELSADDIQEWDVKDAPQSAIAEAMPARIGVYRIVTLLGAGAMGRVYKGFDEQLERYVAIKVVSKSLAENQIYIERFKREAKILASISHPNIALIYYFGNLEGLPYFCMEYLASGSIESLLQSRKVIEPENAISYVIQAAAGLREALSKGVLHMDVKPSNLMLADEGRLKIVDFGLAQTKRQMDDLDRNIVGTPLYIAPEQIVGGVADVRMDIYSLGVTFFEMLYGFAPFKGESVADIFHAKLNGEMPPRSELSPAVPISCYNLVTRMIARDPEQRITNYSELIEELESVRRHSVAVETPEVLEQPTAGVVSMRGLLFDHPFAEIIGKIVTHQLTGKLTINWGQLAKHLHFRQGRLIALLSNQEGEDFIELVISRLPDEAKRMRKLQSHQSLDLFEDFSTVIQKITPDSRLRLSQDLRAHVEKILENLFSWMTGEFIFEQGEFPRQLDLDLDAFEMLNQGVRKSVQYDLIRRRLFDGNCALRQDPEFIRFLRHLNLQPSDRFLLFRFENQITYRQLSTLSGIAQEEFGRLVYLFYCLGLVHVVKEEAMRSTTGSPAPASEPGPSAPDSATYYTHCAAKSYGEKNYWACVEYCRKALEHREDPNVYRLMGRALATHPRFRTDALDAYKKALALAPDNAGIERDIADLYYQNGSLALAKTQYEEVLRRNPTDPHAAKRLQEIVRKAR